MIKLNCKGNLANKDIRFRLIMLNVSQGKEGHR